MKKNSTLRKLIYLIIFISLFNPGLFSQQQKNEGDVEDLLDFSLESIMEMKVVSASRHEQKIIDSPRSISLITAREIREKNYRSTPEAISELLGVHLQATNYGGGSPILRGLVGNQILIMVDGVRMNNAIYRLGPNQYLNTIDINQIEQIEVVKGAGSVLYGSDALGGLINIITKSSVHKADGTDALVRAFGRYTTADNGSIGRIELGRKIGNLNLYGGASIKKFNNLTGGSNTGLQKSTGYSEWNADFKLDYAPGEQHKFTVGYQHVIQNDVPRSDVIVSGSDLKREWNPELRDLIFLDYNFSNVTSFIDEISTKFSYQTQSEQVYRIQTAKPNVESNNFDKVNTFGATLQLSSSINESQLFTYGADMTFDKVVSNRTDLDFKTGVSSKKVGNVADGAKYSTFALFVQDEIGLTENLHANLGLRYSKVNVKATIIDKSTGEVNVDLSPSALVSSGYLLYKFTEGFNVSLGVSQGFRAPNVDDATVLGSTGSSFEIPNPNLKPERTLNYELGFKLADNSFFSSLFFYYSDIKDLILRLPGTYEGKSFLDLNGNGTKESSEPGILRRDNTGKATIYGFEWEGKYQLSQELETSGKVAWTRGEDKVTKDPLTRVPPLEGMLGAKWRVSNSLWLEYYNLFSLKQDRLSPADKTDKRIPTGGTPGFVTYNLRGGYDINSFGRITLGVENITNTSYKLHGSGIDSPGVNFVFGYDISL